MRVMRLHRSFNFYVGCPVNSIAGLRIELRHQQHINTIVILIHRLVY